MTLEELENSCIELPCKECIMKCKCNMILHKKFETDSGQIIYHTRSICSIMSKYHYTNSKNISIDMCIMAYAICKEFGLEFIKWLELNADWNDSIKNILYLYNEKIQEANSK